MVEALHADVGKDNGSKLEIPQRTEQVENESNLQENSRSQTDSACSDEAISSSDEDDRDELPDENADLTAAELLQKGQGFFRVKKFGQSAEVLSKALEVKVKELGVNEQDWHTDLAQYYLWFGDALLTKEEQSTDLFQFMKTDSVSDAHVLASKVAQKSDGAESVSSVNKRVNEKVDVDVETATSSNSNIVSDSENGTSANDGSEINVDNLEKERKNSCVPNASLCANKNDDSENTCLNLNDANDDLDEGAVSDEQLAFEILEMARKSYARKIDAANIVDLKDIEDVSFVHIRLADIYLMNEKYDEAAKEYQEAVKFRENYNCPIISTICPNVSLGQAFMFTGDYNSSIAAFNKALIVLDDLTAGKLELPDGRNMENYKNTREDIILQLTELRKKAKEVEDKGIAPVPGSQTNASSLVPHTTNTLDTPQLGSVTVKLGVIRREEKSSETTASLSDQSDAAATSAGASHERVKFSRKRDSNSFRVASDATENGTECSRGTAASTSNTESSSVIKRHRVDLTGLAQVD